jgi:hypothetical protein
MLIKRTWSHELLFKKTVVSSLSIVKEYWINNMLDSNEGVEIALLDS